MRLPMISVVIPIYNAEIYLRRCLDSVVRQTYSNTEIILIDDGSTDESGKLCEEYAEADERIKVIHEANRGVSMARNAGLKAVQGEYICFVDADDEVDEDYLQYLYTLLINHEADVSACSVVRIREQTKKENNDTRDKHYSEKFFASNEALPNMIYKKELTGYCVAKLFKRKVVNGLYFDERLKVAEDFVFVFEAINRAEKVAYGDKALYRYYQNKGSCMHDSEWRKYQITWEFFENSENKNYNLNAEAAAAFMNYMFIGALGFYSQIIAKEENRDFRNVLIEYVKDNRRKVLSNKAGKELHRVLALLCCVNAKLGCEICKRVVRINEALNIQIKKPV